MDREQDPTTWHRGLYEVLCKNPNGKRIGKRLHTSFFVCIITWLNTWNSCNIDNQLYSTIYKGKMVNYWGPRSQKLHHYVFWSNYRAWNSSLDETPPFICILKSLLLESIPNGKSPSIGHPGDNSTGNLPSQTCAVLRSTWNWSLDQLPAPCTLDSLLPEAHPSQPSRSRVY